MLSLDEVKQELGIDTDDAYTIARLQRYINVADSWLKGAIGEDYPKDDERAKQLALFVIEDMFDRNASSVKENSTIEKLKTDFILQLQVERRIEADGV